MRRILTSNIALGVLLTVLCIAIFGTIYWINENAVKRLVMKEATHSSENAANFFAKNLPHIEDLLQGKPLRNESYLFLRNALESLQIDRFKLFDMSGKLVVDTGKSEVAHSEDPAGTNLTALEVLKSDRAKVGLEEEIIAGKFYLTAETYVPVIKDHKTFGVAEVYVDVNESVRTHSSAFRFATWFAAGLATLGFAVPATAFVISTHKTRQAQYAAQHDALTDIPNRSHLLRNASPLQSMMNEQGPVSLVHFIDLDHFKEINDQNGHEAGDAALKAVVTNLRLAIRKGDIVARYGGDEFVVIQFGFQTNDDIHASTRRICDALKLPFQFNGKRIPMSASIGTAVAPLHGSTIERLIACGDQAAYVSKQSGRDQQTFFKPEYEEKNNLRRAMEQLIATAIVESRLVLHYQPIFDFTKGTISGFEALVRMRDRAGNLVPPADFIPIAEETGTIVELGSWVLENSCREAATWPQHLTLSVNLSVAQFQRKSIINAACKALAASGLAAHRLMLEVTESLLMLNSADIMVQLNELKELGISVVIDDFGNGYSNFSYMMKFPFDGIKIDRTFAASVGNQESDAFAVVKAIVDLGHVLKMKVTAEGVESREQAESLQIVRCDNAQGYFYSKPVEAGDIASLLLRNFSNQFGLGKTPLPIESSDSVARDQFSAA